MDTHYGILGLLRMRLEMGSGWVKTPPNTETPKQSSVPDTCARHAWHLSTVPQETHTWNQLKREYLYLTNNYIALTVGQVQLQVFYKY